MEKFIEREKLSKKARRELDRKSRKGWNGLSPVTRKSVNKKAYSRKRVRKIDGDWLSVHKEVLVSRIKLHYAFVGKPRKATALLRFPTSA